MQSSVKHFVLNNEYFGSFCYWNLGESVSRWSIRVSPLTPAPLSEKPRRVASVAVNTRTAPGCPHKLLKESQPGGREEGERGNKPLL